MFIGPRLGAGFKHDVENGLSIAPKISFGPSVGVGLVGVAVY